MFRFVVLLGLAVLTTAGSAQNVKFGTDSGEFAKDGICDDRRFIGLGMDSYLDRDDVGKDASDRRFLYQQGGIRLVDVAKSKAQTNCTTINFGRNISEWKDDGLCDDYRFDGPGADSIISIPDVFRDAKDCKSQCQAGNIYYRQSNIHYRQR